MEYTEYRPHREHRYEYDEMVDRLSEALQYGRGYVIDFADVYIRDIEKVANAAREYDDYELRAREYLRQAVAVMQEKIDQYTVETIHEFNNFLAAHPGQFYAMGKELPEPLALERFIAVGEGASVAIALAHADSVIDLSNGGYQLLIDSRTIDT